MAQLSASDIHFVWVYATLLLALWFISFGLGVFYLRGISRRLQQLETPDDLLVDLDLLASGMLAQAILEFQTDLIPKAELIPYLKYHFLEFCSKTGVDPRHQSLFINRALEFSEAHTEELQDMILVDSNFLFEGV